MRRLLLVDGSNLLFQMFYGMPSRIVNSDGKSIHGTLGFTGALLRMLRLIEPTHALVIFDGEQENPRAALDPAYKANRGEDDRELPFDQLPDVHIVLEHLGIAHTETVGAETDDIIAAYVKKSASDLEIFISSQDSDFYQLIGDHVRIVRYRGASTTVCDANFVLDKFGIPPHQYADFKALIGDKSDNIAGIRGIGPKTAAALLRQFGSIDEIIAQSAAIRMPSIRSSIEQESERLRLNRRLICLDGTAPLPIPIENLAYQFHDTTTNEVLSAVNLK